MSIFKTDNNGKRILETSAQFGLLNASPNAIVVIDMDNTIIYVSQRTISFFGFSDDTQLIGKNILEILPPSEHRRAEEAIKKTLDEKIVETEEFIFLRKAKEPITAEINSSCILDDNNNPEAILFTARDITKRKQTEKDLLFTRFVIERSISMNIWLDKNANIKYANGTTYSHLGYSEEELLRLRIFDLDRSIFPQDWNELIFDIKLKNSISFESRFFTRENIAFPVEITFKYLEYNGDELFCAFVRNISERKKAENDLIESEKYYKSIIEQSVAGFFFTDPDTRKIISANKAFCEMLGYSKTEILNFRITDFFAGDKEKLISEIIADFKKSSSVSGEREYVRKDGSSVFLFIISNIITRKEKPVISTVAIDITKLKLMEKALKQSEEKFKLVADYTYDWEYWKN